MGANDHSALPPLPPAVTRQPGTSARPASADVMLPPFVPAAARAAAEYGAAVEATAPAVAVSAEAMSAVTVAEPAAEDGETFPLDAFIVPDDARRVPAGLGSEAVEDVATGEILAVAERLEAIARRVRAHGEAAIHELAAGEDRLDAMVSALLAGYIAGRRG